MNRKDTDNQSQKQNRDVTTELATIKEKLE